MKSLKKIINQALELPAQVISQALVLPADVSMEFSKTCQRGEQLDCRLTIKSQESAIAVEKISVALVAEENVDVDAGYQSGYATVEKKSIALMLGENVDIDTDYQSGYDSESTDVMVTIYVGTVTNKTITVNETITVSNAISLDPNKEYSWAANFAVPKNCNATYLGVHANHIWYLSATITLANRKFLSKKNFSYKWDGLVVL
jgi:uncharacterized cupredoxin-like copper-binding protein